MAGMTNKGKARIYNGFFRNTSVPTNLYIALITAATAPTADTNTMADLTQIAAGNGYTDGGYQLNRDSTDFDTLTEDDTNDWALIQIKDVVWTASGGSIPASGNGARYAVCTDDNATVANREVITWWDLASEHSVGSGGTITLRNLEIRLKEAT